MNNPNRTMLVTCAFPYANGDIHLGHLLEHIQADIWVRYLRMKGHSVVFICSDDTHGTAIMLKAKSMNMNPEKLISSMKDRHQDDLFKFSIIYDNYSSTHQKENKNLCNKIYYLLKKKKFIIEKNISQLYDISCDMFLSDRFVKGTCPKCKASSQYGDNCDSCGAVYNAIELLNPISEISHTTPCIRLSKHLFFKLSYFSPFLKNWIVSGSLQLPVSNQLKEWLSLGLRSWNISRDYPYFGFKIPGYIDKFFYVWMDASIGYMSCFKELCDIKKEINFNDFWSIDSKYELYHFIGKDITYFHGLFWPAILEACGYRKPTKIFAHGYVTFQGLKLSKSKGFMISGRKWLSCFDSDSLRYYFSSKLSNNIEDLEMNLYDYANKINSDIVNNIVNLASRSASFLKKYFFNTLSNVLVNSSLYQQFTREAILIEDLFEERKFSRIIQKIRFLSDLANKYISQKKPWILIKNHLFKDKVHNICSFGIHLFRVLMIFLKPIMPVLAEKTELFLNKPLLWSEIDQPLLSHKINNFSILYHRIERSKVDYFLKKYK
ncbi:methionine--tRNA ligase [Buchnera aphidicola]|uniref:Methionine--tRNA ligase n=1 Tax=Buchnera aphidicola (Cinara strobi) TaxID=1921549 RepID=A0A3B1DKS5_9GAMM|nr:methionine--tRNA ligase [Buchnera aphidicola]VAX76321.1 Methionine--tRNA ligase [Buchnera aphidicola (Cinara strobi)]